MVYIKDWSAFETAATELYGKAPHKARYTIRFVPKSGQLVLKITDDSTCIMYKTFSSIILNRFEALNLRLLSHIGNVRPKARPIPASTTIAGGGDTPIAADEDDPMLGAGVAVGDVKAGGAGVERTGTPAGKTAGGGAGGGGGKKKKKGKK